MLVLLGGGSGAEGAACFTRCGKSRGAIPGGRRRRCWPSGATSTCAPRSWRPRCGCPCASCTAATGARSGWRECCATRRTRSCASAPGSSGRLACGMAQTTGSSSRASGRRWRPGPSRNVPTSASPACTATRTRKVRAHTRAKRRRSRTRPDVRPRTRTTRARPPVQKRAPARPGLARFFPAWMRTGTPCPKQRALRSRGSRRSCGWVWNVVRSARRRPTCTSLSPGVPSPPSSAAPGDARCGARTWTPQQTPCGPGCGASRPRLRMAAGAQARKRSASRAGTPP